MSSKERQTSLGQYLMHKKKIKKLTIGAESHMDSLKDNLDLDSVDSIFELDLKDSKVLIEETTVSKLTP